MTPQQTLRLDIGQSRQCTKDDNGLEFDFEISVISVKDYSIVNFIKGPYFDVCRCLNFYVSEDLICCQKLLAYPSS